MISRIFIMVVILIAPLTARAEIKLVPSYTYMPVLGPIKAKGAVIFNNGRAALAEAPVLPPQFVTVLSSGGWDVFTLVRPNAEDNLYDSSQALITQARKLKRDGYGRIVSVGQSYGGWISFVAAGETDGLFHAIVATAPAAHGQFGQSNSWQKNSQIVSLAKDISSDTRVMAFFFSNDNFDPGGRGEALENILSERGTPHLIVNSPPGHVGHGAAGSALFQTEYGPCILAFIDAPSIKNSFACPRQPFEFIKASFLLPSDIEKSGPVDSSTMLDVAGKWRGWLYNGREMLLIAQSADNDNIRAFLAWRALGKTPAGSFQFVDGRYDAAYSKISFSNQKFQLSLSKRSDGKLDAAWAKGDGSNKSSFILQRIE